MCVRVCVCVLHLRARTHTHTHTQVLCFVFVATVYTCVHVCVRLVAVTLYAQTHINSPRIRTHPPHTPHTYTQHTHAHIRVCILVLYAWVHDSMMIHRKNTHTHAYISHIAHKHVPSVHWFGVGSCTVDDSSMHGSSPARETRLENNGLK